MGSFGQRLQREREMRGITLEEIATSTKIGTRSLRALEEEDFDQLPGGIFNKGFVRAYAKYLGIDEEQAVADYLTASGEDEQPLPNPSANVQSEHTTIRDDSSSGPWVALALLALLGMGGFAGWRWYQNQKVAEQPPPAIVSTPAPPPAQAATPAADPNAPASPDATTTGTDSAAADPSAATNAKATTPELKPELKKDGAATLAGGFLLEVRAKQDAWISYTTDDQPAKEVQMKSTDHAVSIHAQKRVKLVLGNAGGVEISHNGKALPQLGSENQRRVVVFTPEGMQR
ncbi:MAG: helix-turn-helix domain-containing protein [Candidatus Koribacter versatilis]|uniref:Helix-turn-helix domain-containing protein n=1 Tax=Candidatus Korobacter versatilis TaxID=658062 RepID=A0A932AAK6_9BACT|nr:helix-turn-helix domain-containing protein [Candidatus Koribacter versatilis]